MASNKKINLENFKKEIKEDSRPWGKFRSFPYKQAKNIKIITVNPGETLSLQYHHHRSEFWKSLSPGKTLIVFVALGQRKLA
jgi:mannose-6-phosphate isomerase-like protein (cupin superfamily)